MKPLIRLHICVALLLALPPAAASPAAAATISAVPPAIALTVPLGARATATLRLDYGAGQAGAPHIYEAYPAPPTLLPADQPPGPAAVALPRQVERLDLQLASELAAPGSQADFIVYLRDQADLRAAYAIDDWGERGRFVYETLRDHAEKHQADLRATLAARGLAYEPLWIVNAILVRGALDDAEALAARADVALVRADRVAALPPAPPADADKQAPPDRCSPDDPGNPVCWGIRTIGADRAWRDFGVTGQGVVVANIDSGISYTHPALVARYRGNRGGGVYDHNYNWFDPQGFDREPRDTNGHGTHTLGTMVAGTDGTSSMPAVGVAPGARWIAAQGCEGAGCSESDLITSAQWIIAPTDQDGLRPRPDLRPMIVNNSWAGAGGNDWYAGYTAAWRAAGIFPVFAGGNGDPQRAAVCGSIASPGDYPDVVAVGASAQGDSIASFSRLGPAAAGHMKPDFVAPGTFLVGQSGIYGTYPGDDVFYRSLQGTSMAAPHLAGTVALLWSANPALIGDYAQTYAILRETARPLSDTRCGDPPGGPNNVFGHGRIDAYAAVARARVDVPWLLAPPSAPPIAPGASASLSVTLAGDRVPEPGVYTARLQIYGDDLSQPPTSVPVTMTVVATGPTAVVSGRALSAETLEPIAATIGVRDGLGVVAEGGSYSLTLTHGAHEIVATAPGFLPLTKTLLVSGDQSGVDFLMTPDLPRLVASAPAISATLAFGERQQATIALENHGTRPLNYQVSVPDDGFKMRRSDEQGGPAFAWVQLPPDAKALELDDNGIADEVPLGIDFPFYNRVLTETLVTADGMLAFDRPIRYSGPQTRCLPDNEIFFYLIAPLRADLDPAQGGQVRYATVALPEGRAFVLSYEGVPLHDGPPGALYTFQALLYDSGRIVFQYLDLGALPPRLSVGLQRHLNRVQDVGCGVATPVAPGLAIEFTPQLRASQWLGERQTGAIAPGERREIAVTMRWARPTWGAPGDAGCCARYRGRIRITSDDPRLPFVDVPAEVALLPAPHNTWLTFVPTGP